MMEEEEERSSTRRRTADGAIPPALEGPPRALDRAAPQTPLPEAVCDLILRRNWLNNADLAKLAATCRELRGLVERYWAAASTIYLDVGKQYFIERILIEKVHCRCEELVLRGSHDYDARNSPNPNDLRESSVVRLIGELGTALRSVRAIDYSYFSDGALAALARSCATSLETLALDRRPLSVMRNGYNGMRPSIFTNFAHSFSTVVEACKGLKRLEFVWCRELTDSCLVDLGSRLPALTYFSSCWSKITSISAVHISSVTTLQDLHLYTCREWNDEGLIAIADKCVALKNVTLVDVGGISDAGFSHFLKQRGGQLESLHISDLDLITGAGVAEIGMCCSRNLRRLRVSHLSHPDVVKKNPFPEMLGRLSALEELSLGWMEKGVITDEALRAMGKSSTIKRFRRLSLEMCGEVSYEGVLEFARRWASNDDDDDDDDMIHPLGNGGGENHVQGGSNGGSLPKRYLQIECHYIGMSSSAATTSSEKMEDVASDRHDVKPTPPRGVMNRAQFLAEVATLRRVNVLAATGGFTG